MFRYRYCCYCRFRKYYNLWAFDKETICDKFVDRGVPLVQLDEKFAFYANIIEELQQLPTAFNIQCIRLNLKPLLDSICQHAQEWCTTLGEKLAAKNVKNIDKMRLEIKVSFSYTKKKKKKNRKEKIQHFNFLLLERKMVSI